MSDVLKDPVSRILLLKDPVSRILQFHSSSSRILIALAGYPGSGKSTLAEKWMQEVKKEAEPGFFLVLGMDGFHLTKNQLRAMENPEEAIRRRGAPYTFNPSGLTEKIKELRKAYEKDSVGWPGFEHEIGDPVENQILVPPERKVILIEGIYTLYREGEWAGLENLFDETWFLDVSIETAMNRVCKRHMEAWRMNEKEARDKAESNDRLNCAFIAPGREKADFLIPDYRR